jgi:hypothetical protein
MPMSFTATLRVARSTCRTTIRAEEDEHRWRTFLPS